MILDRAGDARGAITTVGMFDSGVGGLSVFRKIEQLAGRAPFGPQLKFIYLGDTARCPYGNRESDEISTFAKQIVDWLIRAGADRIVMACNTSAAAAGATVRLRSSVPIHDLIHPTAEHVAKLDGKVAILATQSTVRSGAFSKAITRLNPDIDVAEIACPDLVPLVETGQIDTAATRVALWSYVKDFELQKVKSVVLGCTHYPFLRDALAKLLPPEISLIDPAEQLVNSLIASENGVIEPSDYISPTAGSAKFFVTGPVGQFAQTAAICLGRELPDLYHLSVDELAGVKPVELVSDSGLSADPVSRVVSPAS